MRTTRKITVTVAAAALAGAVGAGAAQAAPAKAGGAPSSCRPANHTATVAAADSSAGHRHYRVTLRAPRGYAPCTLSGSPTDVRFSHHGTPDGVTAGRYGPQHTAVTFGPGHPVHFDIRVPSSAGGARADEVAFTLRAPGGVIPGESSAGGSLTVDHGTRIGPVRSGA